MDEYGLDTKIEVKNWYDGFVLGIMVERIRKYGFALEGKTVLIG